ncbi:NINE protein [Paenibacillus flagellatus]|uniref:TM2 domain-containing protein n=1 Tax=Paenibacillus flagellatus TaxID=2211139 RepID=A0A2V5KBQ8_9BACL|nr:NINE protein [Paenibacillus flagellatus]PYI56991.1 TM2 domain-containing protein [Paenibacillus flagellatus]
MHNKQDLTLTELMVLNSELKSAEKSTAIAYLMLLGGHLGLHRFYLKRPGTGALQLVLFLLSVVFYFVLSVGAALESDAIIIASTILLILPALALFIWVIVDLFLLPGMLREYNAGVEQDIVQEILRHRHMEQLAGRGRREESL